MSDLEKRKFYSQNYTLQLQGFLIDEEEFVVTPAITRKIGLFEVDTKTKRKPMKPIGDTPDNFIENIIFNGPAPLLSTTRTYDYNGTIQILEVKNIATYVITVNGTVLSTNIDNFLVSKGDVIKFDVCCLTPPTSYPKTIVLGINLA